MIPLQGLFHFMKIMDLAQSTTEVVDMFQVLSDIDGVERIVEDTLNIKNGLNYAQFLEALLMIAHLKTKQAGGSPENATEFTNIYKETLEGIFSNQLFDISKRVQADPLLEKVFNEENNKVFFEHQIMLQAVFDKFALNRMNTYKELHKDGFIEVLRDSEILILPRKLEAEKPTKGKAGKSKGAKDEEARKAEEAKKAELDKKENIQLFEEADAMAAIEKVCSFEHNMMNFYGFLEALIRISEVYPFSTEQLATELTQQGSKVDFLCAKFENKFGADIMQKFE